MSHLEQGRPEVNFVENKYPFCIVWRPIRVLTWLFPFLGHVGIGMSNGVIKDFAKSYEIKADDFGRPAKYILMDPEKVEGGAGTWDAAIELSSNTYGKQKLHPPFFDNCYSYVGYALSNMRYNGDDSWHMSYRSMWIFFKGKYVGFYGFLWTWLPFVITWAGIVLVSLLFINFDSESKIDLV